MTTETDTPEERTTRDSEKDPSKIKILYEGKTYAFKPWQILVMIIAVPLFVIIGYLLLELSAWIRIIVADNTISSLNFVTGLGATMYFRADGLQFDTYSEMLAHVGWLPVFLSETDTIGVFFNLPTREWGERPIQFVTFCTGFQAIIIFAGIILFTPASTDRDARAGIWKRRAFSLFWSSFIFYVVNIIRMWIQLYLAHHFWPDYETIHVSISAASSFIAVIIVLLMHKSLPEFVMSIVWTGMYIKERFFPNVGYKKPKELDGKE